MTTTCYFKGDYVSIQNNIVYNNTWWSSNAESAIVLADSRHIDELTITKMFLIYNQVFGNINFIPYYNENYDDPNYVEQHQMDTGMSVGREGYGTINQTFIIDGSGNKEFYLITKDLVIFCKAIDNTIVLLTFFRGLCDKKFGKVFVWWI